jgi:agmatine/peptidylarginine deiminase
VAIVSRYPSGHRQAPVVDACARRMRAMGYSVSRVTAHVGHDEYATYANSLLANGIALVPQYGSPSLDRAALNVYRRRGFQAHGVDCRLLIQYGGAVHCISMQVPAR